MTSRSCAATSGPWIAMGTGTVAPSPAVSVTRVSRFSILLLKRRTIRSGGRASVASCVGDDSSTMAWPRAGMGHARSSSGRRTSGAACAAARPRLLITGSAPVVEHQVAGVLVVFLLAPLHANHGEIHVVAALQESLVGGPVVSVRRRDHALKLSRAGHLLHRPEQRVQVLGLLLARIDGQELDVGAAVGRFAIGRQVANGEADDLAPLLEQERVAQGEAVDDLDFLAQVHTAPEGIGHAADLLHGLLLLGLLERRVAADRQPRLGVPGGVDDLTPVEQLAGDDHEPLGPVAELLIEDQVLGAVGIRAHSLQRGLVLVEKLLARRQQLLADVLVLVVGEHRHRPHQPDRPPHHGHGGADDLAVALFGDEATPRLHEPAMVDVLGAAEDLPGARADLALEEVAEGLLHHVAHLAEVALADAPDLDEWRATLRIETRPVDRGPHAFSGRPASSSSSVMTPEWSRPPLPLTRSALKSSWTIAVQGSGTPSAREDSMISPKSLKCRSILNPGL